MRGSTNASSLVKTTIITGSFSSTVSTWTDYYSLPQKWTDPSKVKILTIETSTDNGVTWRHGQGSNSANFYVCCAELKNGALRVYNSLSTYVGKLFKVSLIYLD